MFRRYPSNSPGHRFSYPLSRFSFICYNPLRRRFSYLRHVSVGPPLHLSLSLCSLPGVFLEVYLLLFFVSTPRGSECYYPSLGTSPSIRMVGPLSVWTLRCVIPVVLSNNKNKLMVHMYIVNKNTTIFLIVRLLLIRYYMFRPSMLAIFRL